MRVHRSLKKDISMNLVLINHYGILRAAVRDSAYERRLFGRNLQ
jgi:hypothetical protein